MTSSQMPSSQMGLIDFARLVIDALEVSKVEYMLAGALALALFIQAGLMNSKNVMYGVITKVGFFSMKNEMTLLILY